VTPLSTQSLGPVDFFGGAWRGHGVVRSLFNQPLRAFRLEFRGVPAPDEGGFVLDEQVVYDHGARLHRRWTITRDGDAYVGLEASQGGRMRAKPTSGGVRLTYDRPRALPGPNVTSLRLLACWEGEAKVVMRGWTAVFGLVPLLRTSVMLEAVETRTIELDD
jgi:hypothetical protein